MNLLLVIKNPICKNINDWDKRSMQTVTTSPGLPQEKWLYDAHDVSSELMWSAAVRGAENLQKVFLKLKLAQTMIYWFMSDSSPSARAQGGSCDVTRAIIGPDTRRVRATVTDIFYLKSL